MVACVEQYNPPSSGPSVNYLVVDGFLNGTSGSASVKLSRAVPLAMAVTNPLEVGATVSIENDHGATYALSEVGAGTYQADDLVLVESSSYRLRVQTKAGKSYTSEYVLMKKAPALDSISWRPEAEGTRLYVSGHDPSNSTTYYRWVFTETWEYRAPLYSFWKKVNGLPVFRDPDEQVYTCWNSTISTDILTTSTKRFSSDVVSMFPVRYIKKGSRLLSRMYRIDVEQRAISEEEYEYWELIKKTTENLGGLFDPLPSQVTGNVRNDDDESEQVLGYFSAAYVSQKSRFVSFYDLPGYLESVDPYDFECILRFIPINHLELIGGDVFVEQIGQPPTGFTAAIPPCADCRSLGGNNVKPEGWRNL
jgi:hypothetical protein